MGETKKKKPEEEIPEEKPKENEQTPTEEKPEEPPKAEPEEEQLREKSSEEKQADENGDSADKSEQPTEKDDKDEEILRLKTQIAAMQLGISSDCMEDAVAIAESYVKSGKAGDINAALQAVVKKYPDMKADGKEKSGGKGGFKVGADSSDKEKKADDDKLSQAFGIRKKK